MRRILLMPRWTQFGVVAMVAACVFVVFLEVIHSSFDTTAKRRRANTRLTEFRDRLKQDPNDKQALTSLIVALEGSYPFARSSAAALLGQVGPSAKEAVPALARALSSKDASLRREAALSIGEIGPEASAAIPALIETLKLGNCDAAWFAAQALGKIGADAETAIPALVECLDAQNSEQSSGDPSVQLALEAVDALAAFGSEARDAVPALRAKLGHANPYFRFHVAVAIRNIEPEDRESLEVLISFIGDERMGSRALTALGNLGSNANTAVPAIEEYLTHPLSEADRQHALFTLQRLKE